MKYIFILLLLLAAIPAAGMGSRQKAPLLLIDQVISEDTTWRGDILIEGVVVVGRRATLTIEPGTHVRFRKKDSNRDGIGDSEIRVLGGLQAVGTRRLPIRFDSAAANPAIDDWSYVLLFSSSRENTIRYCEFRHAFSGLQVHFSSATVTDSLFEHNREGLRFGRAKLQVRFNTFRGNDIGIRFTRMEGPAAISNNLLTENRLGIFLVPSGQNIQDFFNPDQSGRPWNTGRLLITANNIYGNSWYDLSLGEKQLWDLDAAGNWWGSNDAETIRPSIFDAERDPALGRVIIQPLAPAAIQPAGIRP